jgi:hypothetical protein
VVVGLPWSGSGGVIGLSKKAGPYAIPRRTRSGAADKLAEPALLTFLGLLLVQEGEFLLLKLHEEVLPRDGFERFLLRKRSSLLLLKFLLMARHAHAPERGDRSPPQP